METMGPETVVPPVWKGRKAGCLCAQAIAHRLILCLLLNICCCSGSKHDITEGSLYDPNRLWEKRKIKISLPQAWAYARAHLYIHSIAFHALAKSFFRSS